MIALAIAVSLLAPVAWEQWSGVMTTSARADDSKSVTVKESETGLPKGWFGSSANAGAYESGIDRGVFHGGKASGYVRMHGAGQGDFGTLLQSIQADPYKGRRVRLSAFIKTENAGEGAALWMRVDGEDATLAFDNMDSRRIRGTKDWQKGEIVLDVSEKAQVIVFGVLLAANGKVWVDDFAIETVGKDVPSTNMFDKEQKAAMGFQLGAPLPANVDFEEGIGTLSTPPLPVNAKPMTKIQKEWLQRSTIPSTLRKPDKALPISSR
jgi:hypothetical protein